MTPQKAGVVDLAPRVERAIAALAADADAPLCAYVYDLAGLRAHVAALVASLPERCRLLYAMKANSQPRILGSLVDLVHGFEVASLGEIQRARAVAPDAPLAFGGPGKLDVELEGALREGVELIHVESAHELLRLQRVAQRLGRVQAALLRVNLRGPLPGATLTMAGPTQFGIDEAQVPQVLALAGDCRNLRVEGFHFHSVSNDLDAHAHARLVERYLVHARRWADAFELRLRWVNAGGGIGVNYGRLDQQFDWATFVAQLGAVMDRGCPPGCTVVFECGRYLTAAWGTYAAEVIDLKTTHGCVYAIIKGGTHHFRLPASWRHSHPFSCLPVERWPYPFPRPGVRDRPVTVAGQLCSPKDVLARDTLVEHLRVGDILAFHLAGAYGWSISHHDFLSHPHPQEVFLED